MTQVQEDRLRQFRGLIRPIAQFNLSQFSYSGPEGPGFWVRGCGPITIRVNEPARKADTLYVSLQLSRQFPGWQIKCIRVYDAKNPENGAYFSQRGETRLSYLKGSTITFKLKIVDTERQDESYS